jgi:hypothetical protein
LTAYCNPNSGGVEQTMPAQQEVYPAPPPAVTLKELREEL